MSENHNENDTFPSFPGPCCGCGAGDRPINNLKMLEKKAPVSGTGWGCVQCRLPADGAVAVLCDECLVNGTEPTHAVKGWVANGERMPIEELTEPFHHDMAKHPEEVMH